MSTAQYPSTASRRSESSNAHPARQNSRREELFAAIDHFNDAHDSWANSRDEAPGEDYWDAFDALIDAFASDDIPKDCWQLCALANALAAEGEKFDEREVQFNDANEVVNNVPHLEFFAAREKLADARRDFNVRPTLRPLEPIKTLDKQGVSHEQICRIYGLIDKTTGNVQIHLVQQELDHPGSVINDKWVDPRLALVDGERQSSLERSHAQIRSRSRVRRKDAAVQEVKPCPETPLELWEQGVGIQQAARMLRIPQREVEEMWSAFDQEAGRGREDNGDGSDSSERQASNQPAGFENFDQSGGDEGDESADAIDVAADAGTDIEAKVMQLADQGLSAADIGKALSMDGRRVHAIVKKNRSG